ncbi:MAG: AI-2E family transporter [Polyangiaceae bacterium]
MGSHLARPAARRIFLAVSALVVLAILVLAHAVLLPFVLALVLAYVLTPAVRRVERRMPRWVAILVVYALSLGVVGVSVAVVVPRLVSEGRALAAEWPKLKSQIRDQWLPALDARVARFTGQKPGETRHPEVSPLDTQPPIRIVDTGDGSYDVRFGEGVQVRDRGEGVYRIEQAEPKGSMSSLRMLSEGFDKAVAYMRENSLAILEIGRQIVATVSRAIFNLFMTLMLGGYIILTHERIIAFFRELWSPGARDSFDRFLRRLDRGLSGVVRGQLIICLVNGVLSAIGFSIFDLKYWPILSIVAAVMSLIPIFGSILSSVPAVAIGLTQSPGIAFGVLMWIIGIHQLEANFLNPKIIGDAAKIHPVLVVFSLLVGEHFFQITGALFAVPCMSIAQTVFLHFRESTMGVPDPSASIPPQPSRLSLRSPLPGAVGPPSQPFPPPPAPPPPAPPPPDEPVPDTARAGGG